MQQRKRGMIGDLSSSLEDGADMTQTAAVVDFSQIGSEFDWPFSGN